MQMIATGQLFEPYFYHPDANGADRRLESQYCLQKLDEWIALFKWDQNPKNMNMDWDGEWLDHDLLHRWESTYVIPDVELELKTRISSY